MNDNLQPHVVPPRRHLDPEPSRRSGSIYSMANLGADRFSFQTELGSGERMRLALGPSGGILSEVSSHEGTTIVDARTQTHLTADTFHFPLEDGALSVRGPVALEELAVALTFASDAAPAGRVTAPRCRAGHLEIELPQLEGVVEASHVELSELRVSLEGETTRLVAGSLAIGRVTIPLQQGELTIDQLSITGIELVSKRGATPEVRFSAVELDGAKLDLEGGYVAFGSAVLTGVVVADEITIRRVRGDDAHVVVSKQEPPESAPPGERSVPIDLSFLDGLEGHIHADVNTHVRLPVIPDWRALHRVRLDVRQGRIEFSRLEHGMSKLPDAVLDFNLRDGRLCLDKDIPLVPFDRTTLVSWPLSDTERRHAEEGWVQLSKLLEPHVEIKHRQSGRDEGPRFLQEVRVQDIDINLSLGPDAVIALPSGGHLRLGAAALQGPFNEVSTVEEPAFDGARAYGEIVYRPDTRRPSGAVMVEADDLAIGIEGVKVGERAICVPRMRVAKIRSEVRTRDFAVDRVYTDLEGIEIERVVIAA